MISRLNFTNTSLAVSFFLIAAAVPAAYFLFRISEADLADYRGLVQSANPMNSAVQIAPYSAKQERKGVQKDIVITREGQLLQMRLVCKEALMVLDHNKEGTELIENMKDVKCWMQEELFYLLADGREALKEGSGKLLVRQGNPLNPSDYFDIQTAGVRPMQTLRYLEADSAIYSYKTDQVAAQNVKIFRYVLPGHELNTFIQNTKPSISGTAKSVIFKMTGKEVDFKATQFKALFTDPRINLEGKGKKP